MVKNSRYRKLQLIGYATNKASSGGYCALTPYAFRRVLHHHFSGHYGIIENFEMVKVVDKDSPTKNNINNFDSVYRTIENHALMLAERLWHEITPITIGGDHSQGFSTIKATIFIEVLKQITAANSNIISEADKKQFTELADKNDFKTLAKKIDEHISENSELKNEVQKIINNIHIIWVDAHGDFNTDKTSDSGNFHGMPLAAACGLGCGGIEKIFGAHLNANTGNVHIMCTRDLDEVEEKLMKELGVDFERFDMGNKIYGRMRAKGESKKANKKTFDKVFQNLVSDIKKQSGKIILSIDIDHLSVPETGTPLGAEEHVRNNRFNRSPSGPPLNDTYNALQNLAHDADFLSFDLSEVALGYEENGKFKFGIKASIAGVNILASMLGGDEAQKYIFTAIKKEGGLKKSLGEVAKLYKP